MGQQPCALLTNALNLATILCEPIMCPSQGGQGVISGDAVLTNRDWLSILRDPLVVPGRIVSTNIAADGTTNFVFARPLVSQQSGTKAVVFLSEASVTNTITVSTTNLEFNPGAVLTIYSPWSHAIEAWSTNVFNLFAQPQTASLYKISQGFIAPAFHCGTNYLSGWHWRLNVTNAPTKDMRDNGATLQIGSTTFTKGFCSTGLGSSAGGVAFDYWEMPLGGVTTNFSCVFGQQSQRATSSTGVQLTIFLDGTQAAQTGYITNTASTNVIVNTAGANAIGFYVTESNQSVTMQATLGNCTVYYPYPQ